MCLHITQCTGDARVRRKEVRTERTCNLWRNAWRGTRQHPATRWKKASPLAPSRTVCSTPAVAAEHCRTLQDIALERVKLGTTRIERSRGEQQTGSASSGGCVHCVLPHCPTMTATTLMSPDLWAVSHNRVVCVRHEHTLIVSFRRQTLKLLMTATGGTSSVCPPPCLSGVTPQ